MIMCEGPDHQVVSYWDDTAAKMRGQQSSSFVVEYILVILNDIGCNTKGYHIYPRSKKDIVLILMMEMD